MKLSPFLVLLVAPAAAAQSVDAVAKPDIRLELGASWRISGQQMSDMAVDADGLRYGQNGLSSHRLRLEPVLALAAAATITGELQLATGHIGWDRVNARYRTAEDERNWGPPRSEDGAAFGNGTSWSDQMKLRKLFLTWTTPIGQLRLGRMASHWGLGILANGGDDEAQDWGTPRFGHDRNYGDIVDRVLLVAAPFTFITDTRWATRVQLAVGGDIIERDERTVRGDGDIGRQAIGVLRYAHKATELGVYVAYRDATDVRGDTLNVMAYDFFGKGTYTVGDIELAGTAELAWVLGETTLGRNNAFPKGPLLVQQNGWVGRAGATYKPLAVGLDVEMGYASGDSNPNDRYNRGFSFDPDFNPSLILFEELRAAETVASAAHAADPSRVGVPADAVRLIPTGGSVSNTIYVRPTVRWRWEDLSARLAVMWAQAEEDLVDPYLTNAEAGGVGVNFHGGPSGNHNLGVEVDVGLDYTYRMEGLLEAVAGLQAGRLWPGDAFADAAGKTPEPINLVFGRVMLRWQSL